MKQEYIITDGENYIRKNINGTYKLSSNLSLADSWDSYKVAESILNNSVPRSMRCKLYVAVLDGNNVKKLSLTPEETMERRMEVKADDSKLYKLSQYSFDFDDELQDMIAGFEMVRDTFYKYAGKYRDIEKQLLTIDYAFEDLKHYHGKKALNARDGYKLQKLTKRAFVKRISIKNRLDIAKKLERHYESTIKQIEDICNTIDELRNQKYKPRVLVDLFENDNVDIDI